MTASFTATLRACMAADVGAAVHATVVSANGVGALIGGAPGAGKSSLALHLMALGAGLVCDDSVELFVQGARLMARAPTTTPALIEARGIGLLRVALQPPTPLIVIVDLDLAPPARLPPPVRCDILGISLPVLSGRIGPHLAPALMQILGTGHVPHHD